MTATTTDDLTAMQWAAMWGSDGGFAVVLHEGVEIVDRVPCRVVVASESPSNIDLTIDREISFTFGDHVAGVTLYAESDGWALRKELPGLVLALGDSVVFHPVGLTARRC